MQLSFPSQIRTTFSLLLDLVHNLDLMTLPLEGLLIDGDLIDPCQLEEDSRRNPCFDKTEKILVNEETLTIDFKRILFSRVLTPRIGQDFVHWF
jgi:hypothetical protein